MDATPAAIDPLDPITSGLHDLWERHRANEDGALATYIPELARADPTLFGISVVSTDGVIYRAGDADHRFTIQSVAKPFVYALALCDLGTDGVMRRVGVEPSGEAFNAISLDEVTGQPANPMINAGAIVTTSLIQASSNEQRIDRIVSFLSGFAGRDLHVDEATFESEHLSGDRNRALAYLMKSAGSLTEDVDDVLTAYFRQCSIEVSAVDLAIMAATLANAGCNPVTGDQIVSERVAETAMALMISCGMYDFSGEWLLRVGLPAKSGVAGGLLAASPAQFGFGAYSPLLDSRGNSVRAVATCVGVSENLSLHVLHRPGRHRPVVTVSRLDDRSASPSPSGSAVLVALEGDLEFAAAERLLRELEVLRDQWHAEPPPAAVLFNMDEVSSCRELAVAIVRRLALDVEDLGVTVRAVDRSLRDLLGDVAPEYSSNAEALAAPR